MADNAEKPQVEVPLMPWEVDDGSSATKKPVVKALFDALDSEDEEQSDATDESEVEEDGEDDDSTDSDDDSEDADEEDAEDDDSEEESDDDAEDEGDDEEEPELYEVTLPGGKKAQVTRDELLKGYSRTADYTRKTQELSTKSQALEAEALSLREQRAQYAADLEAIAVLLEEEEPDWDKLRQEKPSEYAAEFADYQRRQKDREKVSAERQRVSDEELKEAREQFAATVTVERVKLLEAIPDWKDEEKSKAGLKQLWEYATSLGYPKEVLDSIADHRLMVILHKAAQFDALQKGKSKIVKKAKGKPVMKPGARVPVKAGKGLKTSTKKEQARRSNALTRSGSVKDAAAYYETFMDD